MLSCARQHFETILFVNAGYSKLVVLMRYETISFNANITSQSIIRSK